MIDIKDIKKENLINTKESKNEFLEYLKHNYPQTISDNTPNLNAIMQLLGLNTKAQGMKLTFTGKALANALYNTPNTKELKFEKDKSINHENTKNIITKGDNLDALKLLKSSYYKKIKMIYIDPPYNTKNDDFIYNDDFRKDYKELLIQTGLLEIDEDGVEIESETLRFFNNIKSSKTHSGWLSFMLPRLKLARDLLREDGVIFISIDDNEQANLKILCDEIFGEENFISCFIWQKNQVEDKQNIFMKDTNTFLYIQKIKRF
ncbi:DNA methyltransferase [Campylobacter bilis]|uniref:DNA methyltransferase n=1 Tax=Campylobacter bilis TaxID=2691918 RepID=UPI0035943D38